MAERAPLNSHPVSSSSLTVILDTYSLANVEDGAMTTEIGTGPKKATPNVSVSSTAKISVRVRNHEDYMALLRSIFRAICVQSSGGRY